MKVELPELGYEYNALEPFIDAKTMEIHHTKHHAGYTNKYNIAIEKHPELEGKTPEELVADPSLVPDDIKDAIRNNGGGYLNHKLFWQILKKDVEIPEAFQEVINKAFGDFSHFKSHFAQVAATVFGSGWAWLVVDENKELKIMHTSNQDNPITLGYTPILGLDVWEHAYYLNYQNKRPEYIEAFFSIVNWEKVNELYQEALDL